MAWGRSRYGILACVLGVASLTIGIGVASGAKKKLQTRSDSTTITLEDTGTATAQCDPGTKAVSGGFDVPGFGPDPGDPFIAAFSSFATGGRNWSSSGFNFEDPGELVSYAYCRDQKLKRRTDETTIGKEATDSVTAKCPRGTKVLSGGFDNPTFGPETGNAIFPFESRKLSKREWIASGSELAGDAGTLAAQVTCREGKKLKTASDETFITSPGLWTATAECEAGQRLISGGFDTGIPFASSEAIVFSSHKVGKRSWEVSMADFAQETVLTAYAYCEKKKKK